MRRTPFNANELAVAGPSAAAQNQYATDPDVLRALPPPDPLDPSDMRGRSIPKVPPRQRCNRGVYDDEVGGNDAAGYPCLPTWCEAPAP